MSQFQFQLSRMYEIPMRLLVPGLVFVQLRLLFVRIIGRFFCEFFLILIVSVVICDLFWLGRAIFFSHSVWCHRFLKRCDKRRNIFFFICTLRLLHFQWNMIIDFFFVCITFFICVAFSHISMFLIAIIECQMIFVLAWIYDSQEF